VNFEERQTEEISLGVVSVQGEEVRLVDGVAIREVFDGVTEG
jgi:hypothetical protein